MERISIETAVARLVERVTPVAEHYSVPTEKAPGHVLWADLFARTAVPPFDRSPLDGYAVRSEDLVGATAVAPALLTVVDCVFAGEWCGRTVASGEAVRIMTGAPIPAGADCVVAQEDTDMGEETVAVFAPMGCGRNICLRGEDVAEGDPIVSKGTRLDWTHMAILAGQGLTELEVCRPLRVAVLSTGDELTAPGGALAPGKIYDSNGPLFRARLAALHVEPVSGHGGADDPEGLAEEIQELLRGCDGLITSGGVSVGQRDYMPQVARLLGAEVLFHGVAVRPGAPAMGLLVDGKPVIALSGNPFAAAAVFEAVARPVLEHMRGCMEVLPQRCAARLRGRFSKQTKMRRLVRAHLVGGEVFVAEMGHASGSMLAMAGCNCLIDIPADSEPLTEGAAVEVILL